MFAGQPEPVPVSAEEALCALLRADYSAAPALASLRKATAATDETAGKGVFGHDFSLDLFANRDRFGQAAWISRVRSAPSPAGGATSTALSTTRFRNAARTSAGTKF